MFVVGNKQQAGLEKGKPPVTISRCIEYYISAYVKQVRRSTFMGGTGMGSFFGDKCAILFFIILFLLLFWGDGFGFGSKC